MRVTLRDAGEGLEARGDVSAAAHLFALFREDGTGEWADARVGEDGALVRDYVPAIENGVAGLRDATGNGGFISGAKTAKTPLISAYGAEEDAYILATGEQIVNSGYFMNKDSRIAVDFAFTDASTSQRQARLFGQDCNDHEQNPRKGTFYISGGDQFAFASCDAASANWNGTGIGVAADVKRHLAVLAISNGSSSYSLSKWNGSAWTDEITPGNLSGGVHRRIQPVGLRPGRDVAGAKPPSRKPLPLTPQCALRLRRRFDTRWGGRPHLLRNRQAPKRALKWSGVFAAALAIPCALALCALRASPPFAPGSAIWYH